MGLVTTPTERCRSPLPARGERVRVRGLVIGFQRRFNLTQPLARPPLLRGLGDLSPLHGERKRSAMVQ
jgi:hypothetical protein